MTNILDAVSKTAAQFIPKSPEHYLGLQVARGLRDLPQLNTYLVLFEHYPVHILVRAYRMAHESGASGASFLAALRQLTDQADEA